MDRRSASVKLAKILSRPEDLRHVEKMYKNAQERRMSVEEKFNSNLNIRLSSVKVSIENINQDLERIQDIRNNFVDIEKLCNSDPSGLIEEINTISNNLVLTYSMLDDDKNLLNIYLELRRIEKLHSSLSAEYLQIEKSLELRLWTLLSNAIELCQTSPETIVMIMRIVEKDEYLDLSRGCKIKGYMGQALEALRKGIDDRFNIGNIIGDLIIVKGRLIQCFPPHYCIESFYQREYCTRIYLKLNEINEFSPGDILELIKLSIPVSDDISSLFIDAYIRRTDQILLEWCDRIIEKDRKYTIETIDSLYFTPGPATLFSFLTAQIKSVEIIKCDELSQKTFNQCIGMIRYFHSKLVELLRLNNELDFDYLIACVNNASRYSQSAFTFCKLSSVSELFDDITIYAIHTLVYQIYSDLDEYTIKIWNAQIGEGEVPILDTILVTLGDNIINYIHGHMFDGPFRILIEEILRTLCQIYSKAIFENNRKFKIDILFNDIKKIRNFFNGGAGLIPLLRNNVIDSCMKTLGTIYLLLISGSDLYFNMILEEVPGLTIKRINKTLALRY